MYIHYSPDGDYRAISNFRMKNLRHFLMYYSFIHINCDEVNLENIDVPKGIDVSFNYESFMYLINLDCDNCPKQIECNKFFPLDILLRLDGTFQVTEIMVHSLLLQHMIHHSFHWIGSAEIRSISQRRILRPVSVIYTHWMILKSQSGRMKTYERSIFRVDTVQYRMFMRRICYEQAR